MTGLHVVTFEDSGYAIGHPPECFETKLGLAACRHRAHALTYLNALGDPGLRGPFLYLLAEDEEIE